MPKISLILSVLALVISAGAWYEAHEARKNFQELTRVGSGMAGSQGPNIDSGFAGARGVGASCTVDSDCDEKMKCDLQKSVCVAK